MESCNYFSKISEDIGEARKIEGGFVNFDGLLEFNDRPIDLFNRWRLTDFDIFCFSHCCFDLPKTTMRNNSNMISLMEQTFRTWKFSMQIMQDLI